MARAVVLISFGGGLSWWDSYGLRCRTTVLTGRGRQLFKRTGLVIINLRSFLPSQTGWAVSIKMKIMIAKKPTTSTARAKPRILDRRYGTDRDRRFGGQSPQYTDVRREQTGGDLVLTRICLASRLRYGAHPVFGIKRSDENFLHLQIAFGRFRATWCCRAGIPAGVRDDLRATTFPGDFASPRPNASESEMR